MSLGATSPPLDIAATRTSDRLAGQITRLIEDGAFPVGSRLPSEREMVDRFGASRSTVRQALQALASQGILQVRDRSGAYVQEPNANRVSQALLLLVNRGSVSVRVGDLVEIRQVLEVEVAGLAAARRSQEHLRDIAAPSPRRRARRR